MFNNINGDNSYIINELQSLSFQTEKLTIKIEDEFGNGTKNLSIKNKDEIEVVIRFLMKMQHYMKRWGAYR